MKKTMHTPDAVTLEVFKNLFASVAEEMGAALRRTAHSPNIRDRLDFSCAIFDRHARMVAQAAHIPVHLGAMQFAVKEAAPSLQSEPGSTWILNDPYGGGTHLPDITLVTPVVVRKKTILFYVASRAHHADMGGASGGSMGAQKEIYAEGLRIPPLPLLSADGTWNQGLLRIIKANVRGPDLLEGDLMAQFAANSTGVMRLEAFLKRYGEKKTRDYAAFLQRYSATRMEKVLTRFPRGTFQAEDFLEDDGVGKGPLRIRVAVRIRGPRVDVDFTGTDAQSPGPVNAPLPVTWSCIQYVFRSLTDPDIPNNSGCFDPIRLEAPPGSLVNARFPAAVAAGNVETSQRIVDCLFKALSKALGDAIPAASCGSMNNLSVSGIHPSTGDPYSYYETTGGGMGARPGQEGMTGVHTHMTNTRNTPVEVLEHTFPLRVERYAIRRGSGGKGRHRGGDGLIRDIRFLSDATVQLLGERRKQGPWGLRGGTPGKPGSDILVRGGKRRKLPSKGSLAVRAGDVLSVRTPGGGGWGKPPDKGS